MKKKPLYTFLTAMTLLWGEPLAAQSVTAPQDTTPPVMNHRIGFSFRPDYVLPTHPVLKTGDQKKMENNLYSMHLKYGFQFPATSYTGKRYPNTYQGIGVAYNTFLSSSMGNPVSVYVFQSSQIARFNRRLALSYEWNFGASFGWNPYDGASNPDNEIVGSKINAYINLGFMLDWKMSRDWTLTGGVVFTHFSNGNTNYPNAGVNSVGVQLGASHRFTSAAPPRLGAFGGAHPLAVSPRWGVDVVAYGATRKQVIAEEAYLIPGIFGIAGVNVNPMYRFNKYLRGGASLDAQYDESANLREHRAGTDEKGEMRFYRPPFREQFSVGLSLRAELVMPIFSINIGLGHNVLYRGRDLKGLYQVVALKTHLTPRFYLHTGYQLSEFRTPKNLMLGFGYRFQGKSR